MKTLFILDDDPDTAELYAQGLMESGRQVRAFYDPTRALAALGNTEVDLLIADLDMPWLDGQHLIDLARQQRPSLPVLVVSGLDEVAGFAARLGLPYLRKPVRLDVLRSTVATLLDGDTRPTVDPDPSYRPASS